MERRDKQLLENSGSNLTQTKSTFLFWEADGTKKEPDLDRKLLNLKHNLPSSSSRAQIALVMGLYSKLQLKLVKVIF